MRIDRVSWLRAGEAARLAGWSVRTIERLAQQLDKATNRPRIRSLCLFGGWKLYSRQDVWKWRRKGKQLTLPPPQ